MYNTQKMIETGRQALKANPRRDATAWEFKQIIDSSGGKWDGITNIYLFGVAVGMRIAAAGQRAGKHPATR